MWCFSSLNAFEFRLILFLIGRKYNFSLLKYKALLINGGGGGGSSFSTPKCVLTQILRKVSSHTKDCTVSVSKNHKVFCHCVLRSSYCLCVVLFPSKSMVP